MKLTEELLETIGEEVEDELDLLTEEYEFEFTSSISPRMKVNKKGGYDITVGLEYITTDDGEGHNDTYKVLGVTDDKIPDLVEFMVDGIINTIRPDDEE